MRERIAAKRGGPLYLRLHYASAVIIKKVDQHLARWGHRSRATPSCACCANKGSHDPERA
jgi:hypothetical protein